jgi:FlaA1/EpsC-like NDP-sugar epimerase
MIVTLSLKLALLLRFDFKPPQLESTLFLQALWILIPLKMSVFLFARFYRGWWEFVGVKDLLRVLWGNLAASLGFATVALLIVGPSFPRSLYILDFLLCFLFTGGARFAVRVYNDALVDELSKPGSKGLLIYGAGAAGRALLREIRSNPSLGYRVIGFLDDDPKKRNADILGLPVLGTGRDAAHIVDSYRNRSPKIEEIVIAMPSATGRQMWEALANCRAAGVACKTIPGISELLSGRVLSAQIRNISLEDLLGREQVQLEEGRIHESLSSRSVLVTGGAGSIGSELCRQIAYYGPERLIPFDQAESDLYKIDLELRQRFPSVNVVPEIGDIRDPLRIEEVICRHRVDSIFHAAAYKHVPMMENQVLEAVRNNILGTWNLAQAAQRNQVSRFLMISSDKAVNPANIMGLTKRVAELIVSGIQESGGGEETQFVSVRFGNVLGSNGSVVPLFQAQIAAGGPVTVTHPEVRRYFMTVREAVQLVLQASTMGNGSEIFVLDMGEPVRILDLATNMIRLAGFIPNEDIEIRITGLRPGEKLFEELMTRGENIQSTYHEKIKIFQGPRIKREYLDSWLLKAESLVKQRSEPALISHLQQLVPEYTPSRPRVGQTTSDRVEAASPH